MRPSEEEELLPKSFKNLCFLKMAVVMASVATLPNADRMHQNIPRHIVKQESIFCFSISTPEMLPRGEDHAEIFQLMPKN